MIIKAKGICENVARLKNTVGKVAGVYQHCFNIVDEQGEMMTMFKDTDRYSTRAVLCKFAGSVQELPICDGMDVRLEMGKINLPQMTIDWTEAERIQLQRQPLFGEAEQRRARGENVARNMGTVLNILKTDGKQSPLLDRDSVIGKRASIGIRRLKSDYTEGLRSLVGLGIGLTPSCDDMLGGMAAWIYLTEGNAHPLPTALRVFLEKHGKEYTTAVSRNLLYDITGGIINDGIYDLICEILCGGKELERLTRRVMDYGSTSGTETCLGIVLGYHFQKKEE